MLRFFLLIIFLPHLAQGNNCEELSLSFFEEIVSIQLNKEKARTPIDYGENVFGLVTSPTWDIRKLDPASSIFINRELGLPKASSALPLDQQWFHFLAKLYEVQGKRLQWTDVGSGYQFAQRLSLKALASLENCDFTGLDLYDWSTVNEKAEPKLAQAHQAELRHAEKIYGRDVFEKNSQIKTKIGDATDFQVDEKQDLITWSASMQYFPRKLEAIANGYNNLADGGFLIVTEDRDQQTWASLIQVANSSFATDQILLPLFFESLERAHIPFSINSDRLNGGSPAIISDTRTLVIRKLPKTHMRIVAQWQSGRIVGSGFVLSKYSLDADEIVKIETFQ